MYVITIRFGSPIVMLLFCRVGRCGNISSVSFEPKSLNKRKRDVNRALCYAEVKSQSLPAFCEGIESRVKPFIPSRLTLSRFARAPKNCPEVSSHRYLSWCSRLDVQQISWWCVVSSPRLHAPRSCEALASLSESSNCVIITGRYLRRGSDPHGFGSKEMFGRTRCFHYYAEYNSMSEGNVLWCVITYIAGSSWSIGSKGMSKP